MNQWLSVSCFLFFFVCIHFFFICIDAIHALKERKGSSRLAIKRYIIANNNVTPGSHFDAQISAAIKRGVAKDIFALPKGKPILKEIFRGESIW